MAKLTAERKASPDTIITEKGEKMLPETKDTPKERDPMDTEEAKKKTARLLQFREFIQKWLLALAAGNPTIEGTSAFVFEKWEFDMLCDVYHNVVVGLGYIPKWFDILITEAMVMTPKIMKVFNIRKMKADLAAKDAQLEASRQREAAMQRKIEELQSQGNNHFQQEAGTTQTWTRPDFAKYWALDADGYFETGQGGYIKKELRTERPDITIPEVYQLAVKHNGLEKVNRIFNLQNSNYAAP